MVHSQLSWITPPGVVAGLKRDMSGPQRMTLTPLSHRKAQNNADELNESTGADIWGDL